MKKEIHLNEKPSFLWVVFGVLVTIYGLYVQVIQTI